MTGLHPFLPDWTVHPGAFLDDILDRCRLTPEEFARRAGIPPETINRILDGTAAIDVPVATAMARPFSASPQLWLDAQATYDADIERGVVSVLTGRGKRTPNELATTSGLRSMHDSNVRRFPEPH